MQNNTFGERLKEERTRLGLTQEALGAVGGVKKLSQFTYEQDQRFPDAGYLIALAAIGVDVQYVMLGKPSVQTLTDEENELLSGFRKLDLRGKVNLLGMVDVVSKTSTEMAKPAASSRVANHFQEKVDIKVGQHLVGDVKGDNVVNMASDKPKKAKKKLDK
ncbi:hypothetical protein BCF11_3417 [Collimonas sp. PA-H2]|uniref:helix-turn-helix domain-containing protein n=1 Tax=Collimonas sp. PA-H2 TaxID=1881062 RepID=UPI000BF86836|nr:transcriptional regulator [Collimonas sp. PA-H2]PFH10979.1 hypothetical protein BCF11_3417 [Collimonas sp. PA-H2]